MLLNKKNLKYYLFYNLKMTNMKKYYLLININKNKDLLLLKNEWNTNREYFTIHIKKDVNILPFELNIKKEKE